MFKRSAAIAAFSLVCLMLAGITVAAATNGTGFQYQYNAGNQQVTLTTPKLDIRVTTGGNVPHFMFWDPNIAQANHRIIYHVQFVQLIEFNDTDGDGVYSPGSDMVVAPILALGSVDWLFIGFITEEDNGDVTAIHFNFTLNEVDGSRYDSLYMELRCHVNAIKTNELKFDIVMMGWPWANNESLLALRWDLMIQSQDYKHTNMPTSFIMRIKRSSLMGPSSPTNTLRMRVMTPSLLIIASKINPTKPQYIWCIPISVIPFLNTIQL